MHDFEWTYKQWVRRVTSWIRRHGTKVLGFAQQAARLDLDIRLGTVSAVYALRGALRLSGVGALNIGPEHLWDGCGGLTLVTEVKQRRSLLERLVGRPPAWLAWV